MAVDTANSSALITFAEFLKKEGRLSIFLLNESFTIDLVELENSEEANETSAELSTWHLFLTNQDLGFSMSSHLLTNDFGSPNSLIAIFCAFILFSTTLYDDFFGAIFFFTSNFFI